MTGRTSYLIRLLSVATVAVVLALTGCSGDDSDVQFNCVEHEECLDSEACIGGACTAEPSEGDSCRQAHDGEEYDVLKCEDGQWVRIDLPDPPTVDAVSADPSTAEPGELVDLTVEVTSDVQERLEYQWTAPVGWDLAADDEPEVKVVAHDTWGETATIEVEVIDPYDQSDSGEVTVSTPAVEITSLEVEPEPAVPEQLQVVTVEVDDPGNSQLTYDWTIPEQWNADSELDGDSIEIVAPGEPEVSGTVEVVVNDSATASTGVSTEANPGPDLENLTVVENPVAPNETATASIDGSHPAGDFDLEYDWNTDTEDWEIQGNTASEELTPPHEPEASTILNVTATDPFGETDDDWVTVETKANQDPVIDNLDSMSGLDPGTTVEVPVEASDPFEFALSYSWEVAGEGWNIVGGQGTDTVEIAVPEDANSTADVTVTVTDDYGGEAQGTSTLTTIENDPPVINNAWANPSGPFERGESFELHVDANDPDGGAVDYQWSTAGDWDIDNPVVPDTTGTAPDYTEDEDILITVTDELGGEATATVDVRTWDYEPDAFGFEDQTGVRPNTWIESNEVTITGIEETVTASCSNCEVRKSGDTYYETMTNVYPEDTLQIRLQSATYGESASASLTVGDTESDTWTVESRAWEGERVFSTCGVENGPSGPTQEDCDGAYGDGTLETEVQVNAGIQTWTVPADGIYSFQALGAGNDGEAGARIEGEVLLQAGTQLEILVGQQGTGSSWDSGGHGGTFVADANGSNTPEPIIVAGGGGRNLGGLTSQSGGDGAVIDGGGDSGVGGTGGDGGQDSDANQGDAGGGGGFYSGGYGTSSLSGNGFVDGGEGGGNRGGFGGGGGPNSEDGSTCRYAGGAGGGYSGGGAANASSSSGCPEIEAGGGGSFLTGDATNTDKIPDYNSNPGQVTIDLVELQ